MSFESSFNATLCARRRMDGNASVLQNFTILISTSSTMDLNALVTDVRGISHVKLGPEYCA